jgi:hypothetical protein
MNYIAKKEERIETPRYLCISPDVLLEDGVLFATDIANKTSVALNELRSSIDTIDVEVLYDRTDWKDATIQSRLKVVERYEILVPHGIALSRIPKVH